MGTSRDIRPRQDKPGETPRFASIWQNFMSGPVLLTQDYAAMQNNKCCYALACIDTGIWYT